MKHPTVALDELVTIFGGGTPSKSRPEYFEGRVPWVSPKDMKSWNIVDSEDHITEEAIDNSSTSLIQPGAVLVVIRSGILKHTLPVAINRVPVTLNQDMKALICGDLVSPDYLGRALQALSSKLLQTVRGTTADNISTDVLRGLEVPLPPLSEQKRLAAILERADRLRRLRRYGLLEDILRPAFLRYFGDPVTNPKAWPKSAFEEVAPSRLGKMLDGKQQTGQHLRHYLRNENVQWNSFDLTDISVMDFDKGDREEFLLRPGDLMICEGGEPGRCAIWRGEIAECYFQKALHRARPIRSKATPEYLLHLMWCLAHKGGFKDHVTSATIAHLTGEKLKQMAVPIPPLNMQQEFTVLANRVACLRSIQREALRQAEHLFQTLLHRAFTRGL